MSKKRHIPDLESVVFGATTDENVITNNGTLESGTPNSDTPDYRSVKTIQMSISAIRIKVAIANTK